MKLQLVLTFALALTLGLVQASKCPDYKVLIFSDTSPDAKGLVKITERFKKTLGGENNGNDPGPIKDGQRAICWDAAGLPFDFPGNFFNDVVTRGIVFKTKGDKFAVSNSGNSTDQGDDKFDSILPKRVTNQFLQFSKLRLFMPISDNKYKVDLTIPATEIPATVTGYGTVFTDVDEPNKTFMEYFDKNGCTIAKVPVKPLNKGLSFLGVAVRDPKNHRKLIPAIAKVVTKLGSVSVKDFLKGKKGDLVAVDDVFFGEPQATKM